MKNTLHNGRTLLSLAAPTGLVLATLCSQGCSNDTNSGTNPSTAGATAMAGTDNSGAGQSTGMAGTAGTNAGGGTAGTNAGGGTAGVAVDGGAGGGGGAGGAADMPRPCEAGVQPENTADLTVLKADIGTRVVGTQQGTEIIRIAQDPTTGSIYYMSMGGGFWQLDVDTGVSTQVNMGQSGGDFRGMTFGSDGTLYLLGHDPAANPQASVVIQKGVPDGGGGRTWTKMAQSEAYPQGGSDFDHRFAGLTISPDGQYLFFGSGSRTDHGEMEAGMREVPVTSAIFRIPTDANNLMLADDDAALAPYLYADGMRNPFDIEFDGDGNLFATENGPDLDFPEEVNWVREGHHYGFPWRFGAYDNPVLDPNYTPDGDTRLHAGYQAFDRGSYVYDDTFPTPPAGVTFTDAIINHGPDGDKFRSDRDSPVLDASDLGMTLPGLTAHRSPLGLAFDKADVLCGDYRKAGFVFSFGPVLDVMGEGGGDLLLLQLEKVGEEYEMTTTQLVAGIEQPVDSVLVDNKLYVVSFLNGANIYEITLPRQAQ